MTTSAFSNKGSLYTVMAVMIVVVMSTSYYCVTRKKFASNMFFSEEGLVHEFPLQRKNHSTTNAHGITRAAQKTVWSLLDANATASLPLPRIGSYQCRDQICSEFLSAKDRENMGFCKTPTSRTVPKCHFMNGTHRAPVALVSFPGSGNTWVRGLLEKATGICTGSPRCDRVIRNSGAIGEHVTSGSVLVVKTHLKYLDFSNSTVLPGKFKAAILIVRNPFQAMVAEWNRKLYTRVKLTKHTHGNGHVGSIPEKYFGNYTKWQAYVSTAITWWKTQILSVLLKNNGCPVLVVCYEDLLKNYTAQVKRMLDFLQVPYSDSSLKKRLAEDYSTFHRKHTSNFEHFTESQKQLVRSGINRVLLQLKEGKKTIPGLKKYLEVYCHVTHF